MKKIGKMLTLVCVAAFYLRSDVPPSVTINIGQLLCVGQCVNVLNVEQ
jgi:hypothetical protein